MRSSSQATIERGSREPTPRRCRTPEPAPTQGGTPEPTPTQSGTPEPTPKQRERRSQIRHALQLAVSLGVLLAVVFAVPSLGSVRHELKAIDPQWIAAGVGLEIASCVSFVIVFRAFF